MEVKPFLVQEYKTESGSNPFRNWLNALDKEVRARIQSRLTRFEAGKLGDYRTIGKGVYEARFAFGPGYRIYFGFEGEQIVLLLLGGDKGSQTRDIIRAQKYWLDYLTRR